ncbi:MAG: hypothetical protein WA192_02865 [Candidatus Acidiferrales bacterium]
MNGDGWFVEVAGGFGYSTDSNAEKGLRVHEMSHDIRPETAPAHGAESPRARRALPRRFIPLILTAWMAIVLLIFVAIRILGSNTFAAMMSRWSHR